MLKELKYYVDIATQMIANDAGKTELFDYIDNAEKCKWDLPKSMDELGWMHKVVSTAARDAIKTSTRTLSGTRPRYKFAPLANNPETKKAANEMERMISTLMQKSSRRNQVPIERDACFCALKYDCVAAQVIYIPYQKKIAKEYKIGNVDELEMAEKDGPFVVKFMNPKSVYARYNTYGLSAVLYVYRQKLIDIQEFWGEQKITGMDKDKDLFTYYDVYDYTDKKNRVVWFDNDKELMRMEHGLPFMPWAVRAGGTNIEDESKYTYQPLLASMALAKSWDTINILETLGVSSEIKRASKPAGIKEGPNPESIGVDYTDATQDVEVPPGHKYTPIDPTPADNDKFNVADRFLDHFSNSAVPRILQDAQFSANTAFGAINTQVQIASSVLRPHKELAEFALADIATLMLNWVHFLKEPITFMGEGLPTGNVKENDFGIEYKLDPQYFDPKELNITVILDAEKPLDKQQLANTGIMCVRDLKMSTESALETMGVEDPEMEIKKHYIESVYETVVEAEKQRILNKVQIEYQQAVSDIQQNAVAKQQAATETSQTATDQGDLMNEELQGANTGMGMNPGMGGQTPMEVNPGQTFEGQNGTDRSGGAINGI